MHNLGDRPVLLIDGEQLVGAKQNRILNTTILVPARTRLEIPVACVEQARWGRSLGAMAPAKALYPAARRAKAEAVTHSVRRAGTHDADQSGILDAYRQRDAHLEVHARALAWKEGQAGVICGIGGAIDCADLCDHPETLRRLYPRLVRSYALDALGIGKGEVDAAAGQRFMGAAVRATMTVHPAVGLGHEVRLTGQEIVGSALIAENRIVHVAVFAGATISTDEQTAALSRRRHLFM